MSITVIERVSSIALLIAKKANLECEEGHRVGECEERCEWRTDVQRETIGALLAELHVSLAILASHHKVLGRCQHNTADAFETKRPHL